MSAEHVRWSFNMDKDHFVENENSNVHSCVSAFRILASWFKSRVFRWLRFIPCLMGSLWNWVIVSCVSDAIHLFHSRNVTATYYKHTMYVEFFLIPIFLSYYWYDVSHILPCQNSRYQFQSMSVSALLLSATSWCVPISEWYLLCFIRVCFIWNHTTFSVF